MTVFLSVILCHTKNICELTNRILQNESGIGLS